MLAAIAELEAATSELRRTVLTGADIAQAGRRLASSSAAVFQLLRAPDAAPSAAAAQLPAPATPLDLTLVTEPATADDTKPVTKLPTRDPAPSHPATPTPRRKPRPITRLLTEPVTKTPRRVRIDPSIVRLQRNPDETGPTWRVLAGTTDKPTIIGYVEAARTTTGKRSSNRWIATTQHNNPVNRPARNRTEAVAVLLDSYRPIGGAR